MDGNKGCHTISRRVVIWNAPKLISKRMTRSISFMRPLNCVVVFESRMQEYLHAWPHIPEKQKTDWEIGKLGKAVEKHFIVRDKYQEWSVVDFETGQIEAVLYYTPVTKALRTSAGKLGNWVVANSLAGCRHLFHKAQRLLPCQRNC
jgi:hypothetical protein